MNRREALAALVALPEVTRLSAAPLQPDDVIVVETESWLTYDGAARIRSTIEAVWPGRKVLVLSRGMTLKVVAQ